MHTSARVDDMEEILIPELLNFLETDRFENAQVERSTATRTGENNFAPSAAHAAAVLSGHLFEAENPSTPRTSNWSAMPSFPPSHEPPSAMEYNQTDLSTAFLANGEFDMRATVSASTNVPPPDVIDPALRSEAPNMQVSNTLWHHGDSLFPSDEELYDGHPEHVTISEQTRRPSASPSPSRGGSSTRSSPNNVTTPSPDSTHEGSTSERERADEQVPARELEPRTSGRPSLIVKLKIRHLSRLNDASEGDAGPSRRPDPRVRHAAALNFYQQDEPASFHPGLDLQYPSHRLRSPAGTYPADYTFGQQCGPTSSYPVLGLQQSLQQTFQQQQSGYGSQYAPPLGIWAPQPSGFAQRYTGIPIDASQWPPGTDLLRRPNGGYFLVPSDARLVATVGEDGRWHEHAGATPYEAEVDDSDTSAAAADWENNENAAIPSQYPDPSLGGYQINIGPPGGEDRRGRTARSGKRARDEYDQQSNAQNEWEAENSRSRVESNSEQEGADTEDEEERPRKRRRALRTLGSSRAPTQSNTQLSATDATIPPLTSLSAQNTIGGPTANAGPSTQPIAQNTLPSLIFPPTGVPTSAPITAPLGPPFPAPALAAPAHFAPALPAPAPLAPGPLGAPGWIGVAMPVAAAPPAAPPPAVVLPGPPLNPVVGITRLRNLPLWNQYPNLTAQQIITHFPSEVRGGTLEYVRNDLERQGGSRNGSHLVTVYGQIHANNIWHGPAFRRAIKFAKDQRDAYHAANPSRPPACQECQFLVLDCSLHHNGSRPCQQCVDAGIVCQ